MSDYARIAAALDFIEANAHSQPSLSQIAAGANLSRWHFQRLFARWVGLTPKRFLQAVTVERARRLLDDSELPLLSASERLGLSSSSRLYDHFVTIDAVTPGEYRTGGVDLGLTYGTATGPFGETFVAWTDRGICSLAFVDDGAPDASLETLMREWPRARVTHDRSGAEKLIGKLFARSGSDADPISLYVHGTNFQIAVWRALLAIPEGRLASYSQIARVVGRPRAVRAVGSAVGANPCGFLIPCHRVIRGNGELGGYRWGLTRKRAINAWEAAVSDGILPVC
jgi:AraC family transcriptional regulator of adaptative response/methylated-DNA-[protein]-cysteine methyltransferase